MRKFFLLTIVCILLIIADTQAQKSYTFIGGGVGGSLYNYDRLDRFVDNYNRSRTGANGSVALTKELGNLKFNSGYHFFYGVLNAELGWMYEVRFSQRISKTRAESGLKFREIDFRNNTCNISGAYTFINSQLLDLSIGANGEFGIMNIYTETDSIARYAVIKDIATGNSIFAQAHLTFGFIGVSARAYYMFQWFTPGLDRMDKDINTNTYETLDKTLNYSDHIGLELSAIIMFGKKKMNTTNKVIRRN